MRKGTMAKKQEKEIEKWVTVNGARVPIFKDGSVGGPKEIRELITGKKATKAKKNIDKPQNELTDKQKKTLAKKELKKHPNDSKTGLLKHQAGEESGVTRKDVEELTAKKDKLKGTKLKTKPISDEEVKAMKENNVFAKKAPEHITGAKSVNELHDKLKSQGLSMESADASAIKRDYRSMNGEKVSLYDKDGNEYRGTFNRYSDGGTEIVNIKKERYNTKDDDTKEKQIARNKAEADDRNNQVSDRVKSYQDKFLKKRSVEEIKEIQSNIEKSGSYLGYTESDMVAMRAIENELKERKKRK